MQALKQAQAWKTLQKTSVLLVRRLEWLRMRRRIGENKAFISLTGWNWATAAIKTPETHFVKAILSSFLKVSISSRTLCCGRSYVCLMQWPQSWANCKLSCSNRFSSFQKCVCEWQYSAAFSNIKRTHSRHKTIMIYFWFSMEFVELLQG